MKKINSDSTYRSQHSFRIMALSLIALISAASVRAGVLASWDMETASNSAKQIASFVHTDITASNLAGNNLNSPASFIGGSVMGGAGDNYIAYARSSGNTQTTAVGAIADSTYFSFTITPEVGQSITLSSITFDAMAGTGGPSDRQFYLMSDKTGYLSSAVLASASTVTGSPLLPYNTSTFDQNFSADLSGSEFANITDSVTFRIYIATPDTSQNIGFDDITLNGAVIPEPSSLVLMVLTGFALVICRRFHLKAKA